MAFSLYYSLDDSAFTLLKGNILNQPDESGRTIYYQFKRSDIPGLAHNQGFYLRLSGLNSSFSEIATGSSLVVGHPQDREEKTNRSSMAFLSQIHGFDPSAKRWRRLDTDSEGNLKVRIV